MRTGEELGGVKTSGTKEIKMRRKWMGEIEKKKKRKKRFFFFFLGLG